MRRLSRKSKRFLVVGLICLAGVIAFWVTDSANRMAARAMSRFEFRSAERWLQIASWSGNWPKSRLLHARLSRKLGQLPQVANDLQVAGSDSSLVEQVRLEAWLTDIQFRHSPRHDDRFYQLLANGSDQAEVCEAYVRGCIASYQLAAALKVLDLWQADFPEQPQPHYYRARLVEHQDNTTKAEQEYRESLKLCATYVPAAYGLARLLEERREFDESRRLYEVVKTHGYHPQPGELGIARCYRLLHQTEAAQRLLSYLTRGETKELSTAWMLVGEAANAHRELPPLEMAYLALELNDHKQAIAGFREALSANPRNWKIRYQLGMALSRDGHPEDAAQEMKLFETASQEVADCERLLDELKSQPDNTQSRFRIGTVLLKHVSESQGIVWLESVLDLDPTHAGAIAALAKVFEEKAKSDPQVEPIARRYRERLGATAGT